MHGEFFSARLAAQLSREIAASAFTIDEIGRDAVTIVVCANKAKRRLLSQRSADRQIAELEKIATRYQANLVAPLDPNGMLIGFQFSSGSYSCGFQNCFFIV